MKETAAERLSQAITALLIRVHDYCEKIANSKIRHGLCLVNPKRAFLKVPDEIILGQLQNIAREHFTPLGATGFYFQYFTPPGLPEVAGKDIQTPATIEDYQLTFRLPEFDITAESEVRARALLYCANEQEMGAWDEWFSPQLEAIRLTPLFYKGLTDLHIIGQIRLQLAQPWANVFEFFVRDYIGKDQTLGIGQQERLLYKEGTEDWRPLFVEIEGLFPNDAAPLIEAYKVARKKAVDSRNPKIKDLLWGFIKYIEGTLIVQSQLSVDMKTDLLKELRSHANKKGKKGYQAKRPTLCLSDIECSQILYLTVQKFGASPKEHAILGEVILFIWICQHAAFSSLNLKVEDVLDLSVTDVDFENLTIHFTQGDSDISGGLTDILLAWIGTPDRQNKRRLFPNLTYDNLEKNLSRLCVNFLGIEGKLQPRDFLAKVHVIPGARISIEIRKQIDEQTELVKGSPYLVNIWQIKKHILDSYKQKKPLNSL